MGKRSGITKSGRVMNPADRERKQMRLKELKRNKKERVKIRHAIVKSRNPRELIENLERLDDQEFDPGNELAINVIAEKRLKIRGAYIKMIALYRNEKNEKEVKVLENMLQDYELERFKKEQHHKALLFSKSANPDDIPLPSGSMLPNAALTPFVAPPVAPQYHPVMKSGILKKTTSTIVKKHKYPPGPPCGLPPDLSMEEDKERLKLQQEFAKERERKVRFLEQAKNNNNNNFDGDDLDEDYAPVEIPESMLASSNEPIPPPQSQAVYMRDGGSTYPLQAAQQQRFYQSNYSTLPPDVQHAQALRGKAQRPGNRQYDETMHSGAVISAAPQVNKPTVEVAASGPVISGAPQLRNIKKETTRFVPTTLRVSRPTPPAPRKTAPNPNQSVLMPQRYGGKNRPSANDNKSTDQACDDFLREIQDLL